MLAISSRSSAVLVTHTAVIEVDQAGDHDLDKVRPAGDCLADQGAVFAEAVKRPPDEAAVASLAADGEAGRAVIDAIFRRQRPRAIRYAELVAAIAQKAHAVGGIVGEAGADPAVLHAVAVHAQRPAEVDAVERHVDVAIAERGRSGDFGCRVGHGRYTFNPEGTMRTSNGRSS